MNCLILLVILYHRSVETSRRECIWRRSWKSTRRTVELWRQRPTTEHTGIDRTWFIYVVFLFSTVLLLMCDWCLHFS